MLLHELPQARILLRAQSAATPLYARTTDLAIALRYTTACLFCCAGSVLVASAELGLCARRACCAECGPQGSGPPQVSTHVGSPVSVHIATLSCLLSTTLSAALVVRQALRLVLRLGLLRLLHSARWL